jgi:hypothetical protein
VDALSGQLAAGESIEVTLQLPPVPIPFHGSARYGAHKNVTFSMHPQQLQWLQEPAFRGGMQRLRPATAFGVMKSDFQVVSSLLYTGPRVCMYQFSEFTCVPCFR